MPAVSPQVRDELTVTGHARPFLKWAGSKKQLLAAYRAFYPPVDSIGTYHEPFLGSGAVFFDLRHQWPTAIPARLSDNNGELITTFTAVRDQVGSVITELQRHERKHDQDYFYAMRAQLPDPENKVEVAARFIYLNKTCFNGLYRVNSRGLFNVPMGRYLRPSIVDPDGLARASTALAGADLRPGHFSDVLKHAKPGDFVYFDPPYVPLSKTAYFTGYTEEAFGPESQGYLAWVYLELARRGCRVMLSNSDAPLVRELYCRFDIIDVKARRSINSRSDRRGPVTEVVILNYELDSGALRSRATASRSAAAKTAKVEKRGTRASR